VFHNVENVLGRMKMEEWAQKQHISQRRQDVLLAAHGMSFALFLRIRS
jgi:hypothetical protein